MLPPIGAHVSTAGGLPKAIDRAVEIGADCLQLFVSSPRVWKVGELPAEAVAEFNSRKEQAAMQAVLVHGLYLCNLASDKPELLEKSVSALSAQMRSCSQIGADLCFHVGSHQGRGMDAAVSSIAPALLACLAESEQSWLLLENTAGAGGTVGRSIEELAQIIDAAGSPDRLGVCLDTCHLYASGYDLTDAEAVEEFLAEFETQIGFDRLRALHANDSKTPLGSNRDRHENILEGEMKAGLATFLNADPIRAIPAFLETPGIDKSGPNADQVAKLRSLYTG